MVMVMICHTSNFAPLSRTICHFEPGLFEDDRNPDSDDLGEDIDDLSDDHGGVYDFPLQQLRTFDHAGLLILFLLK